MLRKAPTAALGKARRTSRSPSRPRAAPPRSPWLPAAGCPVLVKGHPAHPGTSEIVADAIAAAVEKTGMPKGVFSLIQDDGIDAGGRLVQHPLIKAVRFTGSLKGGRALFDLCAQRDEPIPFFGKLGSLSWKGRNMVGPAFTLRYMPARKDRNQLVEFRPEHPRRVAIETCPEGHVLVMDSRKSATAASAGDILITRLMKRGGAGVVTDGGFRDAAAIAQLDIPAYHTRPSSPTNLTTNEAIALNEPIGCGDAPVLPGDVTVGDADCVIVIPAHIADEAVEMTAYEDFVVERVQEGATIIGLYPATDESNLERFAEWRKANGC